MAISDDKRRARAAARSLPPATAEQSAMIVSLIAAELERGGRGWVMAYLALPPEPDLAGLWGAVAGSGVRMAAPAVDWEAGAMVARAVPDRASGVRTVVPRPGVTLREPVPGSPEVPMDQIGVVLVPGVAFDGAGGRLGRGGGFYDRFLGGWRSERRRCGGPARAFGVCTAGRVVAEVPREPHDERVDAIVTERGLVNCEG